MKKLLGIVILFTLVISSTTSFGQEFQTTEGNISATVKNPENWGMSLDEFESGYGIPMSTTWKLKQCCLQENDGRKFSEYCEETNIKEWISNGACIINW